MIQWTNPSKIQHEWIDHWLKIHWWSSLPACYPLNPIDLWHHQDYYLLFKLNLLVAMASTWFGLWSIYRQHRLFPNNVKATFPHRRTFGCASMSCSSVLLGFGDFMWMVAWIPPPPQNTESLRASVFLSRAIWQGLTLAVTTDGTSDRHCCLCVHQSMWEDFSKHRSTSPRASHRGDTSAPFLCRDMNTWHTHTQKGGPAGYEAVCLC